MTRKLLVLLLCCMPIGLAGDDARQKPVLYIVHADWCAPCRVFDHVWTEYRDFRDAIQDSYQVRELDWEKPADQAFARRLGICNPASGTVSVPTYVAVRPDGRKRISYGFTQSTDPVELRGAMADLAADLGVEWPRPQRTQVDPVPLRSQPETRPETSRLVSPERPRVKLGPTIDQAARDGITKLASQSRDLQQSQKRTEQAVQKLQSDVADVRSQVSESRMILSEQLKQSHESTRSEITTITDRLKESIERTILKANPEKPAGVSASPHSGAYIDVGADISTEMKPGATASKWLNVLAKAGRIGLAIAAPEIALPGSALLAAAGFALQVARRRRAARQPAPLGHASNPIVLSDHGEQKTETKFVVTQSDVLGEAYAEAIRRVGNIHRESQPQVIDVLKQVDSAAQQLAHGRRVVRRPTTEPTSEN
jgi:hypothetical protein